MFCPRQCALIHVERLWADNVLTIKGQLLHRRADRSAGRRRGGGSRAAQASDREQASPTAIPTPPSSPLASPRPQPAAAPPLPPPGTIARAVPLRSMRLGLWGKADVVEFLPPGSTPFPIEYKRGQPKKNDCDRVQLCAQAMCLEEMLGLPIPAGALFYGKTRRRLEVPFTADLRATTQQAATDLHDLFSSGHTPAPAYDRRKCDRCSLKTLCLPEKLSRPSRASAYLAQALSPDP